VVPAPGGPEDLIAYGFESEFVGRVPVTVVLDPLTEGDLFAILRNPNCPVIQGKKADFKAYGIDVHFETRRCARSRHWPTGSAPAPAAWRAWSRRRC